MSLDKKSTPPVNRSIPTEKKISIGGDLVDSAAIIGDNNTVNQTITQKFFNIFKSDSESMEQRNRRILLNHVENAWIKGVLDASLHSAALLDLGIKQDPEAVIKYPWAIKKESTDETLPAGTSMLEIFDTIGMGRSLLILGAPGSGKTTMLLELARQLIQCAREDVTQPIPMVFNLSSWTESKTLADWLAQELNNLYSVPRKTAPDWVKGNKLLLLLDGLDEVRQESRVKCVEAINEFRKQNGLTSLAVCSRSQDYADLNAKLSFEGAIEVQPLTQKQITEFFNRFGDEMAGIKQVLKKDSALREMAETPLFLSIMIIAYRDRRDVEILVSGDEKEKRKHLFDTYIEYMFVHQRSRNMVFNKQSMTHWISILAQKLIEHNQAMYLIENTQPAWLSKKKQQEQYELLGRFIFGMIFGFLIAPIFMIFAWVYSSTLVEKLFILMVGMSLGLSIGLLNVLISVPIIKILTKLRKEPTKILTIDVLSWRWVKAKKALWRGLVFGSIAGLFLGALSSPTYGLTYCIAIMLLTGLMGGITSEQLDQTTFAGQKLILTARKILWLFIFGVPVGWLIGGLLIGGFNGGVIFGLFLGILAGLRYSGTVLIRHYTLRFILARNNLLPWRLVPFLDHCVDLIFLRRVGGGYIFVHRLLMEHFAEMYVESPISKGN